jgi:hypothetical protein
MATSSDDGHFSWAKQCSAGESPGAVSLEGGEDELRVMT